MWGNTNSDKFDKLIEIKDRKKYSYQDLLELYRLLKKKKNTTRKIVIISNHMEKNNHFHKLIIYGIYKKKYTIYFESQSYKDRKSLYKDFHITKIHVLEIFNWSEKDFNEYLEECAISSIE